MYSISDKSMSSIGFGTIILYLLSLTFFLIAAFSSYLFVTGLILGVLFFITPSVIIGVMVKQRLGT